MKNLIQKTKYVLLDSEDGSSNIEIIVWMSVVLVIATVLFLFRDSVKNFITNATGQVDSLQVN